MAKPMPLKGTYPKFSVCVFFAVLSTEARGNKGSFLLLLQELGQLLLYAQRSANQDDMRYFSVMISIINHNH